VVVKSDDCPGMIGGVTLTVQLSAPLLVDQVTFTEAPVFVNCSVLVAGAMTPLGAAGGSSYEDQIIFDRPGELLRTHQLKQ
jgi:NhaP-type Na+/H+ or K+/H+ antiporter